MTSDGVTINLGSLVTGQQRNVLVKMDTSHGLPYLQTVVRCREGVECVSTGIDQDYVEKLTVENFRLLFTSQGKKALELMSTRQGCEAKNLINTLITMIKSSIVGGNLFIIDLLKDLEGQVTEALSRDDWYTKWGKHYLLSLVRAHGVQQCNNFKDPGVQHYGGDKFVETRDKADDVFCKIPPPIPSVSSTIYGGGYGGGYGYTSCGQSIAPNQPVNMSVYNNSGSSCFDGNCVVTMADGQMKPVKCIIKGDMVLSVGTNSKVVCITKSECQSGKTQLVKLEGGLLITPYHPVRFDNEWRFPCHLGMSSQISCQYVYNFVLETGHVMIINDIECVTLGHGFTDNSVIAHSYFGTQRVIEDLSSMTGWDDGLINLRAGCLERDVQTGLVTGLHQ
jgi:hypothetical protein